MVKNNKCNLIIKDQELRLTQLSASSGWAAKLGPGTLREILDCLPLMDHPDLLVGMNNIDDAGVYRLTEEKALIQTIDFFTPIVDDPYSYGQIAAANSLSDVYAMGGKPLTVLNLVAFPSKKLAISVLGDILKGAVDKVLEAGAILLGGHSVEDDEPKFGLAVTGIVHPDKIITNSGAKPGDKLILTKPLGTGIIATAIKAGMAAAEVIDEVSSWMATLNKEAAAAMIDVGVHACTDITGYGLLGHALEMAQGSKVDLLIKAGEVPILAAAKEYAAMGLVPAGAYNNRHYIKDSLTFAVGIDDVTQDIFCDPQTSGGLLISVPADKSERLIRTLAERGITVAREIGRVIAGTGKISITA